MTADFMQKMALEVVQPARAKNNPINCAYSLGQGLYQMVKHWNDVAGYQPIQGLVITMLSVCQLLQAHVSIGHWAPPAHDKVLWFYRSTHLQPSSFIRFALEMLVAIITRAMEMWRKYDKDDTFLESTSKARTMLMRLLKAAEKNGECPLNYEGEEEETRAKEDEKAKLPEEYKKKLDGYMAIRKLNEQRLSLNIRETDSAQLAKAFIAEHNGVVAAIAELLGCCGALGRYIEYQTTIVAPESEALHHASASLADSMEKMRKRITLFMPEIPAIRQVDIETITSLEPVSGYLFLSLRDLLGFAEEVISAAIELGDDEGLEFLEQHRIDEDLVAENVKFCVRAKDNIEKGEKRVIRQAIKLLANQKPSAMRKNTKRSIDADEYDGEGVVKKRSKVQENTDRLSHPSPLNVLKGKGAISQYPDDIKTKTKTIRWAPLPERVFPEGHKFNENMARSGNGRAKWARGLTMPKEAVVLPNGRLNQIDADSARVYMLMPGHPSKPIIWSDKDDELEKLERHRAERRRSKPLQKYRAKQVEERKKRMQ
ncbi:hypothetical protein CYLTODRAFT_426106 [Cylindrobasidium torrendii FP15055 ss-10]|uniref:Uncharacterized protein n=1 Tax=Cylindrobasidium torrendii FP15055 ss-10 TaxID=1314674 RepID=A0A0D7AZV4_9AGAR|nr:hypothetical protein CYLTODRAFT_426106 [Cylindrobasidium torrendii FP15055 ss-10]